MTFWQMFDYALGVALFGWVWVLIGVGFWGMVKDAWEDA